MTTITDNQRAVLQAAAHGANLVAWPIPKRLGLNPGPAAIVIKGLMKKGLLDERAALGEDAVWRTDEQGRQLTLVITKAGLAAIGMMPGGGEEGEAGEAVTAGAATSSPVDAGDAGTEAATNDADLIDIEAERPLSPEPAPASGHTGPTTAEPGRFQPPRPGSKLALIVALLSRPEGATVEEMAKAASWQAHSVRGVMSGALVRKFGLTIVSEPVQGRGRVYRAKTDSGGAHPA